MIRHVEGSTALADDRVLTPEEMLAIESFSVLRDWPEGGMVFRRGEAGRSMYVVATGEVKLILDGGARCKCVSEKCFFGELTLLGAGDRRSGDAVASRGTRLLELDEPGYLALIGVHPQLAVKLLARSARSLLASERRLVAELESRNRELERTLDYLRRTREELSSAELQAQTDPLTGLFNRRCLGLQVPRLIARSHDTGLALALILIDLDRFKSVNDTWGHQAGDAVLVAVARALRSSVRWSDLPCRIGGDEFAVVLVDLPGREAAVARARDVFAAASAVCVELGGNRVRVGTSHGGALLQPGEDLPELMRRADASLYAAKTRGRGALVWEGDPVLIAPPEKATAR